MTDFSGLEGPATSFDRAAYGAPMASAVADAQEHALGEIIYLKTRAESVGRQSQSATNSNAGTALHRAAMSVMSDGLVEMAAIKDVPVTEENVSLMAATALSMLAPQDIYHLAKGKPQADLHAAYAINRVLDVYAASQVIRLVLQWLGHDHLDAGQMIIFAETWVRDCFVANLGDTRLRWPEPAMMAEAFLRSRSRRLVEIQHPDKRPARASYFLERCCEPGTATVKSRPVAPVPLLLRCRFIPGNLGAIMPNGRLVMTRAGCQIVSWWNADQLHRDPKEGPAREEIGVSYHHVEYWVRGVQHRDEAEGPAAIGRDPTTGTILNETYWRNGEIHRDGGPASIMHHPNGRLAAVAWYRHGKPHRELAEGPALTHWDADGNIIRNEFWLNGEYVGPVCEEPDAGTSKPSGNRGTRRKTRSRKGKRRAMKNRPKSKIAAVDGTEVRDG